MGTYKTKTPTGFKCTRSGTALKFEWTCGDQDYYAGQWFRQVFLENGAYRRISWTQVDGRNREYTCYLPALTNYYPYTNTYLESFAFWLRGKRRDGLPSGTGVSWSEEGGLVYNIAVPRAPSLDNSFNKDRQNETSFVWQSPDADNNTEYMLTDYERETILVQDCNTDNGANVNWSKASRYSGGETSQVITESTVFANYYSYTRWYRVRCRGPRGASGWVYSRHVYAQPPYPYSVEANVDFSNNSGYRVSANWVADATIAHPIDTTYVEYGTVTPNVSVTTDNDKSHAELIDPVLASASQVSVTADTSGKDGIVFTTNDGASDYDKVLAVRVYTQHDNQKSYSPAAYVYGSFGGLKAPSNVVLSNFDPVTKRIHVNLTRNTEVVGSHTALYYKTASDPANSICIGIIKDSTTLPLTVQLPDSCIDEEFIIGAKNRVGDYSPIEPLEDEYTNYTLTNELIISDTEWKGGDVPKPPRDVTLSSSDVGAITVGWDWTWTAATGAELSWSTDEKSWNSTNQPSTYSVYNTSASNWIIAGLDVGTWYVRVRLFKENEGGITYGAYSETKSIKLASAPLTPSLILSDTVIPDDGEITCYWAYTTTDGSGQMHAEVCEATVVDGVITYGDIIARTTTAQHITIGAKDQGWLEGETHHLAVRVISASGEASDGWSAPVSFSVAKKIPFAILSTSLTDVTETIGESTVTYKALTSMPLSIEVGSTEDGYNLSDDTTVDSTKIYYELEDGEYVVVADPTGNPHENEYYERTITTGKVTIIVERAEPYHLDRPDGTMYDGFERETIAIINQDSVGTSVINRDSLIGIFDNGCKYRITAMITDAYGQIANADPIDFVVKWAHRAVMPTADVESFQEDDYVTIMPISPSITGYDYTYDKCDIYRLSADQPVLILRDAEFDTKYVDPYPTLCKFGGYRIVYKTIDGDYTTEDGNLAWTDYNDTGSYIIEQFRTVINFGNNSISLPYNLSINNSWSKDFTETKYLGGSIQGDWSSAVSRSSDISTTVVIDQDPDTVKALRDLAVYTGPCHIRTPEGSNFIADVQVKDNREEKWVNKLSKITLTITKIDYEVLDGVDYDTWIGQ